MSNNYLVNVPKLKGRDNYSEWTFAAENFLVLEGMLHCIKPVGEKPVPPEDDEKTKAKLIMTIDSKLYVHIKDVSSSKMLWDKLKSLFDDSGFSRKISLLRTLTSIRLENSDTMASYITQMIETGQKLCGTGFQISDEWIGCLLLAGLTEKYMPMIMAIEHSGLRITTDVIKAKLLDMAGKDGGEHREGNAAFASSQKWQHSNNKKYGSMVHKENGFIESTKVKDGRSYSKNVNVKCYKCKQPGHYRNQCPNNYSSTSNEKKVSRKSTNAFSAVFLNGNYNKEDWYIDSGASAHLTANKDWVINPCYKKTEDIVIANNNMLRVLCTGDVNIITQTDECEYEVPIKDILCIPELTTNLLSVNQLIRNGNQVNFTKDGCSIYNRNGHLVAVADVFNGVYKLRMPKYVYAMSTVSGEVWHRRLGHVNSNYLNKMTSAVEGMNLHDKVNISKMTCSICCEGKQCRLPFSHVGSRSKEVLELVHTDLCGPMEVPSIGGSKYFLLFVDDYSRMIFVYFLRHKSEVLTYFKEFKAKIENQINKCIKAIRSDNGLEFCNKEFELFLQKEGIHHQKTNPYTPEQNGLCERCNRTVVEKARCLLFDADLGKEFWAEATNTAVYLHNRIIASGLEGKTPYEVWTGTKPMNRIMPPVPQEMPARQESETAASFDGDRIVISGMSGLFPESQSVNDLSEILYNKINPIQPNNTRWTYSHPEVVQCIGMVPGLNHFDAQFFKVHYRLGKCMDSMARKVLEQSYQAIYDAGMSPEQLSNKKVGVFIGSCFSETEKACFYDASSRTGFGIAGCNKAMFANRISYWLNAKGPSVAIDQACCSSLAALEQGYLAINRGDCESAIVGGSNICLHPQSSVHYSRIMKLCDDGKTKSFDQNADGCAKSEAINVFFLQKAKDALRIYGEIRHIKCEFTAIMESETGPRYGFYREPRVMINFIKNFYEESGVSPNAVEYVEAFGSAVPDADKVELEVIDEIFCRDREDPLMVGSVMSNIGYSEAASGISAVTKVLLGYQKGLLAGNLHCENPRQDVEAVRDGRLKILTDHARFGRTYAAVNGISVTGVNAHVLLHGYYKPKDLNRYKCDIPRLVNISGRQESAVGKIINDLKSRPVDPEELALLHNVYKTRITGHMARGFVILDTKADSTVSLHEKEGYFNDTMRPLWFVYSGMGSQWTGMGAQLMRIPIFAAAVERCQQVLAPKGINIVDIITSNDKTTFDNILHSFVGIAAIQIGLTDILRALGIVPDKIIGHSVGELGCAYADGCLTAEEMILSAYSRGLVSVQTPFIRGSMAAVGLGYKQISQMCPPEIEVACHNSSESSTISGPADVMREFVGALTAEGIFAKEVPSSNIAYHSRYIAEAGPELLKHLKKVIKTPRARSERWVSTSVPQDRWNEPIAKLSSAEYHTNNLLSSVLFEETSSLIPPNAVLVEIAPHGLLQAILKRSLPESCCNIALTRRGHPDNAYLVLEAIGKLYMEGYLPKLEVLYPKIEFPVSSGTPMLSHTVEWVHEEKWGVPLYTSADRQLASSCKFIINVYDDENSYLQGNVLKGKMLYPFAAALVAVWDTLAMFIGVPKKQVSVEFRDVHLFVQPVLHEQRQLRLSVQLHRGTGRFEVMDDISKVATGFIVNKRIRNSLNLKTCDVMDLKSEDIYTLLNNKYYSYSGDFRSIHSANSSVTEALMFWRNNWVTLLDGMLQLNALRRAHDGVSVPKQIGSLQIHVSEHIKCQMDLGGETVLRAEVSDVHNYTRCGGILIEHLKLRDLPLESENTFTLKTFQFVLRFCNKLDFASTLHVYLQIVAENVNRNYVNIASLVNYNKDAKIFKEIKNVLTSIYDVNFKHEEINILDIKENSVNLLADVDLVLIQGLSTDNYICELLYGILRQNTFVVSEEDNTLEKSIRPSALYRTVSIGGEGLQLVRWRPLDAACSRLSTSVFTASDIPLLKKTRAALQPQAHLLVLAPQPPPQGLTDLIRTWRTESVRNQIYLVIMDPKTADELIGSDIELAFNVWNKGQWGGEYYVPLQERYESSTRATLQSASIGDIGSLHWVQAPETRDDGVKVNVHYAALNTVDVLKATGRNPFESENGAVSSGYGMDFSGVTESGSRVMGVVPNGACSSEVRALPELLWPVPDHWNLEDAATVPLPYLSAFYCFLRTISRTRLVNKSESYTLFVHGGAGAMGQAAISIGLGLGYQVFTTVSDVKKKQFLVKLFPQLKEENIGNSRDNSFGDLVLHATNGKGCYIVINNVRGDLKNVSLQCCSDSGTTYDMCQLSHQENYMLPMSFLSRERSYVSLDISSILKNWIAEDIKMLHAMVSEGIALGYVRPLTRVTYAPHAAPRALRLLAASAHRGRVLLHLRDTPLHVLPRIVCKPDEAQLILCDRSSLGLHLADRLISRGAKKLYVHCASLTPYLRYKIRSWQKRDVVVEASSEDLNGEVITALVEKVARLGRTMGGIYVIATDASVKTDGKFLSALNTLDLVSRKLCPSLRYFAVISSDMTGMHTCMDRVNNGYPATLLKFKLTETSPTSGEGLELSASQSLGVVAAAERALHSPRPALLAHQLRAPQAKLLHQIAHVADVAIPEDTSDNITLESFGLSKEKFERIRNFLELTHNVGLNEEEVNALTIQRIREIEDTVTATKFKEVQGLETFYSHTNPDELLATTELVFLSTHTSSASMRDDEFDVTQTYLCIVPGLEGLHNRFNYLCERLKLPALVLQPGLDRPYETIQEAAQKYAQVLLKRIGHKDNFYILGYEWGIPVALEVAAILEGQGMTGTVFCVGVAPEELKVVLEEELSEYKSEEELENGVLEHMFRLMTGDKCARLDEMLRGCHSWSKKLEECVRTLLGRVSHSAQYTRALLQAALGRIAQARRYSSALPPLRSRVVLLRSRRATPASPLQLHALTRGEVSVHELSAPLAHATRDTRCAAIVNSYLDPQLIDRFNNMNLCDSYLLNADTFMNLATD